MISHYFVLLLKDLSIKVQGRTVESSSNNPNSAINSV